VHLAYYIDFQIVAQQKPSDKGQATMPHVYFSGKTDRRHTLCLAW